MDWQLTCRICLESGDMVSLFDWDENNEMLGDKYKYCCGVEIKKSDTLPTLICLNCVDRLTEAYKFKQQCLSSNETLKECLDEFLKSAATAAENSNKPTKGVTETITIKQENGILVQYELPIEHEPTNLPWPRGDSTNNGNTVITKAPEPRKRGRPRKYPNRQGEIVSSPYVHKTTKEADEEPSLTTLLAEGALDVKQEPEDTGVVGDEDDPDFVPEPEMEALEESDDEIRTKPRQNKTRRKVIKIEDGLSEDVLLKETIMAYSEPIPDHILNPQQKPKKKNVSKKKYIYDKTHTCETCGSSFTSNATLQAHIRRHLGIKPYVCSVCGYASVLNEALKRHMLKHTGEKPYKCRICDRRFSDYGTRQKHERLHMGIRPYQCSLCGKSFTYSYVLANHMLTHTGVKKYTCIPCNKKFTKAHHLKYHNKVHHRDLYIKQQMEAEAKQMRQQMNVSNIAGMLSGQLMDGKLHIVQEANDADLESRAEEGEDDVEIVGMLTKTEMDEDVEMHTGDKETHQAVAGMQKGILNEDDFSIVDDEKEHK